MSDPSEIGAVRRAAVAMGGEIGMDETDRGRIGLIVNELASNVLKHAQRGELLLRCVEVRDRLGIEMLVIDHGPGIADVGRAFQDGYSTAGSPGTGLGAVRRLASLFDLHSGVGTGTVAVVRLWPDTPPTAPFQVGVVALPYPGEPVSGDGWGISGDAERMVALVVDGLGHGASAAVAAREAERIFREHDGLAAPDLLDRIHRALKPTRGAAAAVAEIDRREGVVRYAGIGNISAGLYGRHGSRSMVSQSGIVGSDVRRIQQFSYPWSPELLLIVHSDGLSHHWQLDPALLGHHPSVIAGVLYRTASRGRDDVTVLVARFREGVA